MEEMIRAYTYIFCSVFLYVGGYIFVYLFLKKRGIKQNVRKRLVIKGTILMLLTVVLNIAETKFFGWNIRAASTAEGVWDWIIAVPYILGLIMVHRGFSQKNKEKENII